MLTFSEKISTVIRLLSLVSLFLGLGILSIEAAQANVSLGPDAQSDAQSVVYVLTFEGAVTPVLRQYVAQNIAEASAEDNIEAIILQLDTPGGSVDVTKSINQDILASPVPIVVYVAPVGAHAGSAGTFITLAGHVAAMAPGSSIGAASPVSAGGEDIGETMEAKVENILSADIENLASRRGEKATEWAIAAVRDAEAATAEKALELGVIDLIAADLTELLEQIDGFEAEVRGRPYVLETADAFVVTKDLSSIQQFLNTLANPSIASLLLSLGTLGLLLEIRTPGIGVPGIAGAICLLLALYALGQMEANFAGLALIFLAVILFAAEALTPTFGVLAAGGIAAFVFGAFLLFDSQGVAVPWPTVIILAVILGGFSFFAGAMGLAAQNRPALTGMESLVGQRAKVKAAFEAGQEGSVFVAGEWWNAQLESGMTEPGDRVEIVDRQGYTLVVKKSDNS